MTAVNLSEDLVTVADRNGWTDRTALYTAERSWSYGEVYDLASGAGTVLARLGIGPDRRVLIALPDDVGWVVCFLACARIGGTAVPVNPALPATDHEFMADDCDAALVITTADLVARFTDSDCLDVDWLLAQAAAAPPSNSVFTDEPLYVHYTSGTTGTPKGVVHRQGNPAVYHRTIGRDCLQMSAEDVTLSVSKLYFTYGFCNSFVFPLYSGSSVVLATERLTPPVAAELVARHRVTRLYAVPSWYARMILDADPSDFSSVTAAVAGGERLRAELAEEAAEFLGAPLLNQLGATEIGCAATANSLDFNVAGTIGRAVPEFSVRVTDGNGDPVDDGTEGDLRVRGPVLMAGYLNRPDATSEVLVDGWLLTKDRVVRNTDGTYTHVRRVDDMEMVGGITMSPLEVEDLLGTHDNVREVAVAAVPDVSGATKLRAFVVPASSDLPPENLEAELIALARSQLAAFKVPRSVHLVETLPRTASGKLRRHMLRERII
ncbi:MAG: AMP-binding protein [Pseudonocardiales bacterium]|nr:AMP-binding protein [Pseudonocardiales bacterium]